jgi:hypothetical protein
MWSRLRLRKISVTDCTDTDEKGGHLTLLSMTAGAPPTALRSVTPRSRIRGFTMATVAAWRVAPSPATCYFTAVRTLAVEAEERRCRCHSWLPGSRASWAWLPRACASGIGSRRSSHRRCLNAQDATPSKRLCYRATYVKRAFRRICVRSTN